VRTQGTETYVRGDILPGERVVATPEEPVQIGAKRLVGLGSDAPLDLAHRARQRCHRVVHAVREPGAELADRRAATGMREFFAEHGDLAVALLEVALRLLQTGERPLELGVRLVQRRVLRDQLALEIAALGGVAGDTRRDRSGADVVDVRDRECDPYRIAVEPLQRHILVQPGSVHDIRGDGAAIVSGKQLLGIAPDEGLARPTDHVLEALVCR